MSLGMQYTYHDTSTTSIACNIFILCSLMDGASQKKFKISNILKRSKRTGERHTESCGLGLAVGLLPDIALVLLRRIVNSVMMDVSFVIVVVFILTLVVWCCVRCF